MKRFFILCMMVNFLCAMQEGQQEMPKEVIELLEEQEIDVSDAEMITAVLSDDPQLILAALVRGSNPNQIYYNPLMYAVLTGNIKLIKLLLDYGADPYFNYPNFKISVVAMLEQDGFPQALKEYEELIRKWFKMPPLPVARTA